MSDVIIARVVVLREDGLVVAIDHDGDRGRIGLPGGHVRRGEAPEQAAIRELLEETGLVSRRLKPLVAIEEPGRVSYVFAAAAPGSNPALRSSREGRARWVSPRELLKGKHGRFNRVALQALLQS